MTGSAVEQITISCPRRLIRPSCVDENGSRYESSAKSVALLMQSSGRGWSAPSGFLWDLYNFVRVTVSKTYPPSGT
jgi:hypothetical protein